MSARCTCDKVVRFPDEHREEICEAKSQEGARELRSSRKAPSESNISYPHLHSHASAGGGLHKKRDLFCLWLFGRGFLDAPHRMLDLANEEIQFKR